MTVEVVAEALMVKEERLPLTDACPAQLTEPPVREFALRRCDRGVFAFAAAFLTTSSMYLETDFSDRDSGEPGSGLLMFANGELVISSLRKKEDDVDSFSILPLAPQGPRQIFHYVYGSCENSLRLYRCNHLLPLSPGRQAFKTANNLDFFVEHLSGLEFHMRLAEADNTPESKEYLAALSTRLASEQCDVFKQQVADDHHEDRLPCSIGITPFWGGYGGAAHSTAPYEQKLDYLRATVCSMAKYVENIMIGACTDFRREAYGNMTDVEMVQSANIPVPFELVEMECGAGTHAIYR